MLFLGIILWKGASCFNGEVCFSDGGGLFFKWEMCPMGGGIILMGGGGVKKKKDRGGGCPAPMLPPTMGNPAVCIKSIKLKNGTRAMTKAKNECLYCVLT